MSDEQKLILRARDFWTSLFLIILSCFFLWRTSFIPLSGANNAGVGGIQWFNSAAIVPLGILIALLILSFILLINAIKSGGAKQALTTIGIGWNRQEAVRFFTVFIILLAYIGGLVPRVDFIISSALLITALIYGYHGGHAQRSVISTIVIAVPALVALIGFLPQKSWKEPTDDIITLVIFLVFTLFVLFQARKEKVLRIVPVLAILFPTLLVLAMAFGFRQNVPARSGLLFKQIEYHYFVTLRDWWGR